MRSRKFGYLIALGTAAALLAGCTSSPGQSATETGASADASANVYLYQAPVSFNPFKPNQGGEQLTESLVYDNLVTTGVDSVFTPQLAQSWDVSADAKTFTFHLVPDIKWSDGKPFTADDVVFSYNLYADPAVKAATSSALSGVDGYDAFQSGEAKNLRGVTAVDKNTVQITLSSPNAGFLSLIGTGIAFSILPQHIMGTVDKAGMLDDPFFDLPTVGMGPYTMTAFKVGQGVELKANPNYRTPVGIGKLYLKIVTTDVATSQLATGEIDLAQVSALDLDTVTGIPGIEVSSAPSPGFTRMAVNTTKSSLSDERVRQAFLYAIDRQGVVDGIYKGKATLLNSSNLTTWALPNDLNPYAYDPAKAKALLSDAGFDATKEVTISWVPGQSDRDQMANVIIKNLRDAGVNAVAKQTDAGSLVKSYEDKSFDLALFGGGVYAPDPSSIFSINSCATLYPTGSNTSFFCNEELDALMKQGAESGDQAVRAPLYQDAARLENELVPYLWMNIPLINWASSDRLQGFINNGDPFNAFWNAADWTIGK